MLQFNCSTVPSTVALPAVATKGSDVVRVLEVTRYVCLG